MTQTLRSPLVSVAAMDMYGWQHSPEQPNPHLASTKRNRSRGVILSRQGWQKLTQAEVLYNEFGYRYTYEQLSERSRLDKRTVSRLLSCEIKVDKRTLKTFFHAFNLSLEAGDYTLSNSIRSSAITSKAPTYAIPTTQSVEVEQLVEELSQLKQRMSEYERLFHRLGLNETYVNQQVGAWTAHRNYE
jgi:transcriptional regulator with XRE-family HTH domain